MKGMKGKSTGIGLEKAMPKMNKAAMNEEMRYKAEADMRTMHEAHAVMTDPKRMKNVEKVMHESMATMEKMKKMGGK